MLSSRRPLFLVLVLLSALPAASHAAQIEIQFPLNRTVYQTNEAIPLAVVRQDANALAAGDAASGEVEAAVGSHTGPFRLRVAPAHQQRVQV